MMFSPPLCVPTAQILLLESITEADAELEVVCCVDGSQRSTENAGCRIADADYCVVSVKAYDRARGGVQFDHYARVERKVVVAGPTDRTEAVSATVESRSYFTDRHDTGPRLDEGTDVARAHAR